VRRVKRTPVANLITLSRFPLLVVIVLLLYAASPVARLLSAALVVLSIGLDSLDGFIARRRHEVSLMGSVLDIMADRAVELVMWVVYAHLGLIPVAIPIVYILRGTVVDSLRSRFVGQGTAPFKGMHTRLGSWLVGSPWMRTSYALAKMVSFAGLAVAHALASYPAQDTPAARLDLAQVSLFLFNVTSWVSVAFCLARGLPVIIEALPVTDGGASVFEDETPRP